MDHPPHPGADHEGRAGGPFDIGPIRSDEVEPLFDLFGHIVGADEGYPHAAPLTRDAFEATWVRPVTTVVVARAAPVEDPSPTGAPPCPTVAGAYYLKPNQPGRAAHIANAGYVVDRRYRGRGVGRALVLDSIDRAPRLGFDAIQFNLVFESNPARRLYAELGWVEIGRVPRAVDGEDAIIYWRAV